MQVADLADLSLEQLSTITVTSASRREERLVDAPASIFVITGEDIRRSGATTLPEAIALAPNAQVARGDQNQALASARGGLFGTSNKMLVLVDGRTIYTPLFAGVFWDAQAILLADVERIEVISGPGGTLWGTNAVNGVINIITRTSATTQGMLATVAAGGDLRRAGVRQGGTMGQGATWRVYSLYDHRRANELASGDSARDAAERWQAGFRADWERASGMSTVQGDVYRANVDNIGGGRDLSGGNLRGRWTRLLGDRSELSVQAYLDRASRRHEGTFEERLDTAELELQHGIRYGGQGHLVWGASHRAVRDHTVTTPTLGFSPADRSLQFTSLYVQDEQGFGPAWTATLGVRAERSSYTSVEWMPQVRISYAPVPNQVFWGSLARAVRAPSRIDRELAVPGAPPYVIGPDDAFHSERADVAELGWRGRGPWRTTLSLTAFHHRFDDLRTLEPGGPAGLYHIENGGKGRTSGAEGWAEARFHPDWRLVGGFVAMSNVFELQPGHVDLSSDKLGNNPRHTALLRSLWNVTPVHELDVTARYVSRLPNPEVPAHLVTDVRAGWRLSREIDLSLVVDDVFNRRYAEAGAASQRALFGRTAFVRLTWAPH